MSQQRSTPFHFSDAFSRGHDPIAHAAGPDVQHMSDPSSMSVSLSLSLSSGTRLICRCAEAAVTLVSWRTNFVPSAQLDVLLWDQRDVFCNLMHHMRKRHLELMLHDVL